MSRLATFTYYTDVGEGRGQVSFTFVIHVLIYIIVQECS